MRRIQVDFSRDVVFTKSTSVYSYTFTLLVPRILKYVCGQKKKPNSVDLISDTYMRDFYRGKFSK